ncbi:CGNR zinc finger domain-containing protein [Gorillibacterium massiliense]|uniref:CGNR zinc finger domain-containing protein n=1 Tax=Gorillibacterium massiliense TaxID=1280390 RepID=UPI0004B8B325|nr:ABATE domain-containing protein [Gorillibacterium massiliense]
MLWDDFLNSEWREWRANGAVHDSLTDPEWVKKWLSDHRLSVYRPPNEDELAELKKLRSVLLQMVYILTAGSRLSSDAMNELNTAMAQGSMVRRLTETDEGYRLESAPLKHDWHQVLADIAASFAQTLVEGEISRIRVCDNPNCLWVYYDSTRNRSKRYCSDAACGNLMKVRRFRARQKENKSE